MARYIDSDKAIEWFTPYLHTEENIPPEIVLEGLRYIPTADVAPVVRCKDCQYWQDNNGGYPHPDCRWGHEETPDENDFCSYGERKDCDG